MTRWGYSKGHAVRSVPRSIDEARKHFDAGLDYKTAARATLYREFAGVSARPEGPELFAAMGCYRKEHRVDDRVAAR